MSSAEGSMSVTKLEEDKQLDFNQPLLSVRKLPSEFPSKERENKREGKIPNAAVPSLPKSEIPKSGLLTNPGAVPFVWEQSPGRCKDGREDLPLQFPGRPKLPPGSRVNPVNVKGYSNGREDRYGTDETLTEYFAASDSGTEAYEDAIASISRTDSFFMNCSVSGVSELDGPQFGSSRMDADLQTRDFMMGRFLPAAEAIASENPQFTARKPPISRKKTVSKEMARHGSECLDIAVPNSLPEKPKNDSIMHNVHSVEAAEAESDEDDDYMNDISSAKACGWLPRLCLQTSFSILNPIPGLRPPRPTRRAPMTQPNDGKYGQEKRSYRTNGNKLMFKAYNQVGSYRQKTAPYQKTSDHSANLEKKEVIEESEKFKCSENYDSPSSCNGSTTSFRELLAREKIEWESDSGSAIVEKNVCIESINCDQYPVDAGELIDFGIGNVNEKEKTETSSVDSSVRDLKHFSPDDEDQKPVLAIVVMKPEPETDSKIAVAIQELALSNDVALHEEHSVAESRCSNDSANGDGFIVPPPLPKSPSESWLQRTLPAVSARGTSRAAVGYARTPAKPSK